jgi:hypothetical protein
MGAYLFSRRPPFAITHITPEPIMTETFINETLGWTYKAVDYVLFPMGLTMDDNYFYVAYGKNDKEGWIIKLKIKEFLSFFRPVLTVLLGESEMNEEKTDVIRGTFHYIKNSTQDLTLPFIESYVDQYRQSHEKHHHNHRHHPSQSKSEHSHNLAQE